MGTFRSSCSGWPTCNTQRWQRAKQRVGYGHLYQARFKSFPIENDAHFYTVVRYVERNALRAGLVGRAEDWPWGSLCRRVVGRRTPLLADWPLPEPPDWRVLVDEPQTEAELEAIRRCVRRGCPYGTSTWANSAAEELGLQSTMRSRGRPSRNPN
jgi:putative transposase